jgi:hypothetical protein
VAHGKIENQISELRVPGLRPHPSPSPTGFARGQPPPRLAAPFCNSDNPLFVGIPRGFRRRATTQTNRTEREEAATNRGKSVDFVRVQFTRLIEEMLAKLAMESSLGSCRSTIELRPHRFFSQIVFSSANSLFSFYSLSSEAR